MVTCNNVAIVYFEDGLSQRERDICIYSKSLNVEMHAPIISQHIHQIIGPLLFPRGE